MQEVFGYDQAHNHNHNHSNNHIGNGGDSGNSGDNNAGSHGPDRHGCGEEYGYTNQSRVNATVVHNRGLGHDDMDSQVQILQQHISQAEATAHAQAEVQAAAQAHAQVEEQADAQAQVQALRN